eukprot:755655-Hanusia_phi.AAC.2
MSSTARSPCWRGSDGSYSSLRLLGSDKLIGCAGRRRRPRCEGKRYDDEGPAREPWRLPSRAIAAISRRASIAPQSTSLTFPSSFCLVGSGRARYLCLHLISYMTRIHLYYCQDAPPPPPPPSPWPSRPPPHHCGCSAIIRGHVLTGIQLPTGWQEQSRDSSEWFTGVVQYLTPMPQQTLMHEPGR